MTATMEAIAMSYCNLLERVERIEQHMLEFDRELRELAAELQRIERIIISEEEREDGRSIRCSDLDLRG